MSNREPGPTSVAITADQHERAQPEEDEPLCGPHGGPLRVLTVGIYYAPDHTGIAPYTTALCEYLAARGAAVSVFTGVPHYPSWRVDPGYRRRLTTVDRRERLEIRRLRHYVPGRQDALRRAGYELTFAAQVARQRLSERPDLVLAVVPSLLSAVAAARIARRSGARLVVWVQDLMGRSAAQSGMDGGSAVAGAVGAIERRLLQQADQVLVLNNHFADYAASIGVSPDRIAVRPNWTHVAPPSRRPRSETRARLGWKPGETIVLHSGNMGLKQDLGNVVEAARLADCAGRTDVRFVLMGDGSQRPELQALGDGIAALNFRPPALSADFPDVLAAADMLLINERPTSVDMSLPSKLTSYFQGGRPVLAASPAAGGTAAEVKASGGGLILEPGQPAKLLDAVRALAADPASMANLSECARRYATEQLAAPAAMHDLASMLVPSP